MSRVKRRSSKLFNHDVSSYYVTFGLSRAFEKNLFYLDNF